MFLSYTKEYRNSFLSFTVLIFERAAIRANSCNFVFPISDFLITLRKILSALILTLRAMIGLLPAVDIATCIIPSILIIEGYDKSLKDGSSTAYTNDPIECPFSTKLRFNILSSVEASIKNIFL